MAFELNLNSPNLTHLGSHSESLVGIWSSIHDTSEVGKYVHSDQFLENAERYATQYNAVPYFQGLLASALRSCKNIPADCIVLDIGSGAGNSVLAMLNLYERCHVIATDISVPLLKILKRHLQEKSLDDRCSIVQMNAESIPADIGKVDLVVGAAILHHLFAPQNVIVSAAKILKPGGHAIFFEPFENGNSLTAFFFKQILEDPKAKKLNAFIKDALAQFVNDITFRKGRDKSAPEYLKMDDKCLFTRAYFREHAEKNGFTVHKIDAIHPVVTMFEEQLATRLRILLNFPYEQLPEWVRKKAQEFDAFFSADMREDMLIDGAIVLTKS